MCPQTSCQGGSFALESVAAFVWIGWQACAGMGGRFGLEYALYPFIVIDWPGAKMRGYLMYDLLRLANSMRLSTRALRREVLRHCQIVDIEPVSARGHLLAGLGYLGLNLGCFPPEVYAETSRICFNNLSDALKE